MIMRKGNQKYKYHKTLETTVDFFSKSWQKIAEQQQQMKIIINTRKRKEESISTNNYEQKRLYIQEPTQRKLQTKNE